MNIIRVIYVSRRTFSKNVNIGIQGKLRISQKSGSNVNAEALNHDDLNEFEAEFINADKFYDIHKREVNSLKGIHKNQIVANKYFKEDKDSNFLTSIEKQKICELHKHDPQEWTVERLSESFPASPQTIKRIIKSNWSPTSIKKVLNYDTIVIDNWKRFKTGTIPVSPLLREHLQKFKDRQIVLLGEDLLTKTLIPQKPELPKPNNKYFCKISESHLNRLENNQHNNEALQNGKEMVANTNISRDIIKDDEKIVLKNHNPLTAHDKSLLKNKVSKQKLTLNEFIKRELPEIYRTRPEKAITLLHVYKKQFESENSLATDIKENMMESNNIKTTKEEVTLDSSNKDDSPRTSIDPVETTDTELYRLGIKKI